MIPLFFNFIDVVMKFTVCSLYFFMQEVLNNLFRKQNQGYRGKRLQMIDEVLQTAARFGFAAAEDVRQAIENEIEEEKDFARLEGILIGAGGILVLFFITILIGRSSPEKK